MMSNSSKQTDNGVTQRIWGGKVANRKNYKGIA